MQTENKSTELKNFECKSDCKVIDGVSYCAIEIAGEFSGWHTEISQMHMLLRFYREIDGRTEQRLYPFFVQCTSEKSRLSVRGSVDVRTEYILSDFKVHHPESPFRVALLYVNQEMQWREQVLEAEIPVEWLEHHMKKESVLHSVGRKVTYGLCTLFLPIWLLSGALAVKGIGKLRPSAKGMSGKKAMLYHAHDMVKGWTGYGYSVREYKTNYFKRWYERFRKKVTQTSGVLFLSERAVDDGGNLDRVRKALKKENTLEITEFLTTRPVHKLTGKELKECAALAARARVIVLEDFFPQLHALSVRNDTEILQMWHACGAFKLFGLSELGKTSLSQDTRNHRSYTAALTSSEGIAPFYSEAFGIDINCIKPVGVPRTDVFFDRKYREETIEELYKRYPEWQNKKIILFAPTFRGSGNKTAYYPMEKFPINEVMDRLPKDVVLIVKQHPFVKSDIIVEDCYKSRVFDLNGKENINDLLFVTDLLVTDYSSTVFEAALLDIPMLFYTFDLEEYLSERDLYFDFSAFAPGAIIREFDELLSEINRNLGHEQKVSVDEKFREFFLGALDGNSTERTVELIHNLYDGKD
ncbi:MAG: CDP-glycerol glycerophosphotransferase family protein [Lachnospiraceae bacterium]|nr:CDP-glycerol glycerophosphotransferase family protein [Lachnospiraceae bacterium]